MSSSNLDFWTEASKYEVGVENLKKGKSVRYWNKLFNLKVLIMQSWAIFPILKKLHFEERRFTLLLKKVTLSYHILQKWPQLFLFILKYESQR